MKNSIKHIAFGRNLSRLFFVSACLLVLFALVTLSPIVCKGEQTAEAVTGTALGSSLTLDVVSSTASADLTGLTQEQQARLKDGIFIDSSSISFSVTTDNFLVINYSFLQKTIMASFLLKIII